MTERNDDETRAIPRGADEPTRAMPLPDETRPMDEATRAIHPPASARREAAGPVTERIAVPAQRSVAGWLIALIALIAVAAGAALGYSQSDGDRDGVVAQALVGPDGGVLEFGDVGRLEIPAGALPTATGITVRRVTNENRVRIGSGPEAASEVHDPGELELYAFEPVDLSFQQPVTITLPRPATGSTILIDTPDGLRVVSADDASARTVTLTTDSFSFRDR